jgi:hypothetical protein
MPIAATGRATCRQKLKKDMRTAAMAGTGDVMEEEAW